MGTLSQRYNEDFLNRAEERKEKLQYEKLTVGRKTAGRVDHILNLLFQTHQNYYFGYHEAAVCLSGILLEQALTVLLEEKLAAAGRLKTRYKNRDALVSGPNELNRSSLGLLLELAKSYGICTQAQYDEMRTLQFIRNTSIHGMLPEFELDEKNRIRKAKTEFKSVVLPEEEVRAHTVGCDSPELWAYYALTRTRAVIDEIFKPRAVRLPPRTNE